MAKAGTRVSKMARHRFSITTSPGPANLVYSPKTCEGDAGYLASLAFDDMGGRWSPAWGMENVIAALEHRDRVSRISIDHTSSLILETLLPVMQEPFPVLKFLDLDTRVSIPDSFLGGSAPDLRHLYLEAVPFPTLPTLLLSATSLRCARSARQDLKINFTCNADIWGTSGFF